MRVLRVAIAALGVAGYACSLVYDVDEHSALPACVPRTCADYIGRCGGFTDPCSGLSETCQCPIPTEQDCTGLAIGPDSGAPPLDGSADASADATSFLDAADGAVASEPPGYCHCRGQTGCWLYATTVRRAGDAGELGNGRDWTNPRGIVAGVTGCAQVTLPAGATSKALVATAFDFAEEIPSGSCIIGISAFIARSADRAGVRDKEVRLIVDGQLMGTAVAHTDENWKLTEEPRAYGGCRFNWGACWNDRITLPGFGVSIRATNTAVNAEAVARVCRVELQVYFTKPDECSESCPIPCSP